MKALARLSVLVTALAAACTTEYSSPTPRGTVPAVPLPQAVVDPSRLYTTPEEIVPFVAGDRDGIPTESGDSIIRRFDDAYAHEKRPRLAVYLNRALSDDVGEWHSDARIVVGSHASTIEKKGGKVVESEESDVEVVAAVQRRAPQDSRANPEETWMWEFEDGFTRPLLTGRARLVDRTLMLRLASAKASDQRPDKVPSVQRIEMDALKTHADVLVELLVARSSRAAYGYEFRATAKEVHTGILLANVSSLHWSAQSQTRRSYEATDQGYVAQDTLPPLHEVAGRLSLELMASLSDCWSSVPVADYRADRRPSATSPEAATDSSQSVVSVRIRRVRVIPGAVEPGGRLRLEMEYAIDVPEGTSEVEVQESWQLFQGNSLLTSVAPKVDHRTSGVWRSGVDINSPDHAATGVYQVKNRVITPVGLDETCTEFKVAAP